jgi:zinc carboxypeptidase/immune inhibitor InhA-like protein
VRFRKAARVVPVMALALTVIPHSGFPAAPASSRIIVRIAIPAGSDVNPLLGLGLDVAGTGRDGSWDVIVDDRELAAIRAAGFAAAPIDITPRGPHGASQSPLAQPGLGAYHTLAEAHTELAAYVAAHPAIALLDTIGFSIQGRAIEAVKISDNVGVQEAEPEVLIMGCHHARELMSVEVPLYLMRRLLDGYGSDPVITSLVDERQIWIVPIVNPDGYVYVEQHSGGQSDTWWRKNRRANADGTFGVDLNRNYGYLWGFDNVGSSPTPSSDTYRGTGPFSEPEAVAIRDFVAAHQFRISASFHSYGELVLYPWGYALADTPDHPVFKALGDSLASQNGYLAGNPKSGAIYLTNGGSDDWLYGEVTAKPRLFGYTFELNTAADGGFAPADAMIGPTCDRNWGPLLTVLRYGDQPRRVLPPAARPGRPEALYVSGTGYRLRWNYPAPDLFNPPATHDVRQIDSFTQTTDDAESGISDWDTTLVAWSAARSASATHSYYSGVGDSRTSVLTARVRVDVAPGDSLVVNAFWDLEALHDFWYAEASTNAGASWIPLPGDHTTNANPFGQNRGNGVTGASGGFARAAFSLANFANEDVLLRFRCITDGATHGEGLYLDDVTPVGRESGISVVSTGSPDTTYILVSPPTGTTHYQVRSVDTEAQRGQWSARARLDIDPAAAAVPDAGASRDLLGLASPNPFNPATRVPFRLGRGKPGTFSLRLFDVSGREVALLAAGWDEGLGSVRSARWDGRDRSGRPLSSGVYLLRLSTVRGTETRKATLLR